MTAILFVILLLVCWIALLFNWIKLMRVKTMLRKNLEKNHPEIRNNLSFRSGVIIPTNLAEGASSFLNLIISIGSTKGYRRFVNSFVDIEKIEQTNDLNLNKQINRLIRLNSIFLRIWITMFTSLIVAFVFWPK